MVPLPVEIAVKPPTGSGRVLAVTAFDGAESEPSTPELLLADTSKV
jgi:hypothetical protein